MMIRMISYISLAHLFCNEMEIFYYQALHEKANSWAHKHKANLEQKLNTQFTEYN